MLGEPVSKAFVYDLEQALQEQAAEKLLTAVQDGDLILGELLSVDFLRELHRRLYVAAQDGDVIELYDWDVDKRLYIDLLRQYDRHRDPRDLAAFVSTKPLGE